MSLPSVLCSAFPASRAEMMMFVEDDDIGANPMNLDKVE